MLLTEDKTDIQQFGISLRGKNNQVDNRLGYYQHLYFTTDEEPKECDNPCWCINTIKNTWNADIIYYQGTMPMYHYKGFRKIVATTDKRLTEEHDDSVPFPKMKSSGIGLISQQFVEEYVKAGGIDEVYLECETNYINWKHDDLIEALIDTLEIKIDQNNCVITHPVEPKLYTKEEVETLIKRAFSDFRQKNKSVQYVVGGGNPNFNGKKRNYKVKDVYTWLKENLK